MRYNAQAQEQGQLRREHENNAQVKDGGQPKQAVEKESSFGLWEGSESSERKQIASAMVNWQGSCNLE